MKKTKLLKKGLTLFLILFLCINNFAAIVSDNDGSTFVTKAEFEAMKKNFAEQVDNYNESIDAKIDGAIAAYLAGIRLSKVSELNSMLNEINQRFVDSTTLGWPTTRLGTYRKWYINLGALYCLIGTAYTASQIQYLTGSIDNARWKTENSSDYGIYFYGVKDDDYTYRLQKYMQCYPYASVGGIYTSGAQAKRNPTVTVTIETKTFTNSDASAFSADQDTWNINMGGFSKNVSVTKSFGITDSMYDVTLDCVTGNELSSAQEKFVESKDQNVPGATDTDVTADMMGWELRGTNDSGAGITKIGWTHQAANGNTKIRIYRHKYKEPTRLVILNEKATSIYGDKVYYFEGLPIFTNDVGNGEVEMELKFTNAGGKMTVFEIQNRRFDNTPLSTTGAKPEYKIGNHMIAENGKTVKIKFDVKKDETYWIKARPLGSNNMDNPTSIMTKKISLTEE